MNIIKIVIGNGNTTNGNLDLSGDDTTGGTTQVSTKDIVVWTITDTSNVGSIDSIKGKKGSKNLFKKKPVAVDDDNRIFLGIVDSSVTGEEDYNIFWYAKDDPVTTRKCDPKIQIKIKGDGDSEDGKKQKKKAAPKKKTASKKAKK